MMKDILLNICENTKQKGFDVQINVFISKEKKLLFLIKNWKNYPKEKKVQQE